MTRNVTEELFVHIQRVSPQDLQCLDEKNVAWLPPLRTLRPETVVPVIRRALGASPGVFVFLERLAWLYCWLMQRRHIRPWLLFRFGGRAVQFDYDVLLGNLADALQSIPRHTTINAWRDSGTYYVCLINNYADPNTQISGAIFLVLRRGQRFAAAYARTHEELLTLTAGLHVALRWESVELLRELHANLDAAFWAGRQDVGGTPLFRSDSSASNMARFIWDCYQRQHNLATHRHAF